MKPSIEALKITEKSKNKFEAIKLAAKMGYLATLLYSFKGQNETHEFTYQVVDPLIDQDKQYHAHYRTGIYVREGDCVRWMGSEEVNSNHKKIVGFVYAGDMAGNIIPEGQKFMVKASGEIMEYIPWENGAGLPDVIMLGRRYESWQYNKSQVEPYFE